MEKSTMWLRKCYVWFEKRAKKKIKHYMLRDKLLKFFTACRITHCISLGRLPLLGAAERNGPDLSQQQVQPCCDPAEVAALPRGMLRAGRVIAEIAQQQLAETSSTWQVAQALLEIWKWHRSGHASSSGKGQTKKPEPFTAPPEQKNFVRTVNTYFLSHTSECAGWFLRGQSILPTPGRHSACATKVSFITEASTASGPKPLHSGLLWSLPQI